MAWQPMDSAPRDGTPILIRYHNDVCYDYFVAWANNHNDDYPWQDNHNAWPASRCDEWHELPD